MKHTVSKNPTPDTLRCPGSVSSSSQAAQFLGSIPENYDHGLGPHIFDGYAEDLAIRICALRPTRVLELAAGTGIVTRKLRDTLPSECSLVATDLNLPMLEVAKGKFEPGESISFERADATQLRFDDTSFDLIVCQFGVMFFSNKGRSFAEARRVLEPGGSYVFSVWDSWQANPFAQITHEVTAAFFTGELPGFYKVPFGYYDTDVIEEAVSEAGFTQVDIEPVALTVPIPSPVKFATGLVYGNPLYDEILARGGDPATIRATVSAAIERQLGSEMPLQALIVRASLS